MRSIGLKESDNLNEMISQLLALTRLRAARMDASEPEVDLSALACSGAVSTLRSAQCYRSVQVVSSDTCSINGVEELLRSAVENVVRNAVRHAQELRFEVALRKQNGNAVISVRDRGKGVPEEALEKIFRPFYRTEGCARSPEWRWHRFGLAITERAVRMHGGSVQATNAATAVCRLKCV